MPSNYGATHNFKLGDKVQILDGREISDVLGWHSRMTDLIGRKITLTPEHISMLDYRGKISHKACYWSKNWLIKRGRARCSHCRRSIRGEAKYARVNIRKVFLCETCYAEMFVNCTACGNHGSRDQYQQHGRRLLCPNCFREVNKINIRSLPPPTRENVNELLATICPDRLSFIEAETEEIANEKTTLEGNMDDDLIPEIIKIVGEVPSPFYVFGLVDRVEYAIHLDGFKNVERAKNILRETLPELSERNIMVEDSASRIPRLGIACTLRHEKTPELIIACKKIAQLEVDTVNDNAELAEVLIKIKEGGKIGCAV